MDNKTNDRTGELLDIAKNYGVEDDLFFKTTFERYQKQISFLKQLEDEIEKDGTTITKEYVKGRENVYVNPAIKEHTRIVDSANKTVSTLIKVISIAQKNRPEEPDPLYEYLSGKRDIP